jgi:hypothetical protein
MKSLTTMTLAGATLTALLGVSLAAATYFQSDDEATMPPMPTPQAEHEWLQRYVGTWEFTTTIHIDRDQPPVTAKGHETVRSVGGFWIIGESTSEFMGTTMTNIITIGYDAEQAKYIGMSVDSMSSHIWQYEGHVNETGDQLELTWTGPCPRQPGEMIDFRGVTEFKSNDQRHFVAYNRTDDDQWEKMVEVQFKRTD